MNLIYKHKFLAAVSAGIIAFFIGLLVIHYPIIFFIAHVLATCLVAIAIYRLLSDSELKDKEQKLLKEKFQKEKEKAFRGYNSYVNQLSNVIAGINHEVSPLLGGIQNKIARIKASKCLPEANFLLKKLDEIEVAADTTIKIFKTRSRDVKKLQAYSTTKSNLFDTIETWVGIAMVDRSVKGDISIENIHLQLESLNFEVDHSPLLLSQVILNLVKNSVEHNQNMLENLQIIISGDSLRNCLIYQDNGKGIPDEKLDIIFEPGLTSKKFEKEIHGLGLSLCVDYCECMGSAITAESSRTGAKFVIYFNYDYLKNPAKIHHISNRKNGDMFDR